MAGNNAKEKHTKKRKRFLLHKGILKDIASKSRQENLSKNAYLQMAIKQAVEKYARENLFIFAEIHKERQCEKLY